MFKKGSSFQRPKLVVDLGLKGDDEAVSYGTESGGRRGTLIGRQDDMIVFGGTKAVFSS